MLRRIISAAIALPVVLLLLWLGGLYTFLLIAIVVFMANMEYDKLAKSKGIPHSPCIAAGVSLLFLLDAQFFSGNYALPIMATLMPLALMMPVIKGKPEGALTGSATTVFASVYFGWTLSHALLIRSAYSGTYGFMLIFSLLGLVWLHDSAALLFGVALGGRIKIAPHISPKKSLEGSLGGALVVIALAVFAYPPLAESGLLPAIGLKGQIALAFIVILSCTYGDLGESALKRDAGVKDSGMFLPGHGGFMDRIDSLLLFIPAVYWLLNFILGW